MITATLVAHFSLLAGVVCPVSGQAVMEGSKAIDVNGVRYRFCSNSCPETFKQDPAAVLRKARASQWLVGVAIFDAVSGKKLTPESARGGTSDFEGVRFAFLNSGNKAAFDADPKAYGKVPEKACSICPVMGHELSNTYMAPVYVDFDGVRYFACCDQCVPRLRANPQKFAASSAGKVGPPKAFEVPAAWQKLTGPGL